MARKTFQVSWKRATVAALFCAVLGVLLFETRLGNGLKFLGYDLLFALPFREDIVPPEVVLIYLDDDSFASYRQSTAQAWDLDLHASLVHRMTEAKARVVVFDVVFNLPSSPAKIANFARAIRENGRVVLAAGLETQSRPGFALTNSILPHVELRDAGGVLGYALLPSPPTVVRQYHVGTPNKASLPWAAARIAGLPVTKAAGAKERESWLNYYGPALTLEHLSYVAATNQPPEFFANKCIFVGALPKTLMAQQEADAFFTPHSLFGRKLFPGVEIGATAFANLMREDSFTVWNETHQAILILLAGLIVGGTLTMLRPWPAASVAAGGVLVMLSAGLLAAQGHVWFSWPVIAFAQIPAALAWSIGGQFARLKFEKEVASRTLEETTRLVEITRATASQKPAFLIPDHSLVRLVGRGAYGEIWLARNTIGTYHVVKLVKRRAFPTDEPYEREFRGVQKFMPISRTHPGFVHILHVGRNDDEKFFYCIMEAGDDRLSGQSINPDTYEPKTLSTEMEETGRIPIEAGLQLGIALSDALEHLHQHQLIHRDVKPPNIIYVRGAPKFADIGLVTDIAGDPKDVSQVGTEGYMAPEGPGTPAADVYSLGKVLYEAIMGRDRRMFPEVPTAVFEEPSDSLLRQLNDIIFRACEVDPQRRYHTAGDLREALRQAAAAARTARK